VFLINNIETTDDEGFLDFERLMVMVQMKH